MGLFGKKEKKEASNVDMPKLPELPKLPESNSPPINYSQENNDDNPIHQLPKFPSSNFGNKMSQNTIKNAITGEDDTPEIPEPNFKISTEPMDREPEMEKRIIPRDTPDTISQPQAPTSSEPVAARGQRATSDEPVFIRIDKFEESMKIFDKVKGKVSEIEDLLNDTKEIKEKENEELNTWQEEIQKLKLQIEKVDKDVFSKIE